MKDNLRKIKYSISSENNIRNLENEEDNNTQVKTFLWKLSNPLIQHKDNIAYVLGRISIVVVGAFYIIDYLYRIKCEQFYKIPNLYFSINNYDCLLRFAVMLMIFIIIVLGYIYLSRKQSKEKNSDDIISEMVFSLVAGIYLGLPNIKYIDDWLIYHSYIDFVVGVAYLEYAWVLFVLCPMLSFCGLFYIKEYSQNKIGKYIRALCILMMVFQCGIYLCGTFNLINVGVKDKRNYEIVTIKNQEYVILSHYGGDMLLAKYEHEDGEPVFITSEYFFKARTEGIFRYEHFNKEPKIR